MSLSRTSSTNSISSDDGGSATGTANGTSIASASRRTRKRFTNVQLTMLEQLFHQNSHPSREEREGVAKTGGMEIKSVTIWFQNKRQTGRKVALHNATNLNNTPLNKTHHRNTLAQFASSSPFSASTHSMSSPSPSCTSSRPSLDRVASRSELRVATPRTPTRRHDPNASIYDNMPSSPLAPPASPPPREYLEFAKTQRTTRTLEWACAAARVSEKGISELGGSLFNSETIKVRGRGRGLPRDAQPVGKCDALDLDDLTDDDEAHEAITPENTWDGNDMRWGVQQQQERSLTNVGGSVPTVGPSKDVRDDEMMRAALALCGLGRR